MQWSQLFPNILLFAICLSIVKCSSTNHLKKKTGWLKKNIREFGTKRQDSEKNKRNLKPPMFETSKSSLVIDEEAKRSKHDKTRSHFNPLTVSTKKHRRIIRQRTRKAFSKTQVNYPEKRHQDTVQSKIETQRKQMRLPSDTINLNLSKDEGSLDEFLNSKKRIKKIVPTHYIRKRNVDTTKLRMSINATKPSDSSFYIPPVCPGGKSCFGRCTGNITEWQRDEKLTCYCDIACHEIFNDCCSDYTKYCGEQKTSNISIKKFKWTCEPLGYYRSSENCTIGEGIWMVSRCADDWPLEEIRIRTKCENPHTFLPKASYIKRSIPVVSGNVVFRNIFCAKCNVHEHLRIEYFSIEIRTNIIAPEHYNFKQTINFLLLHDAEFSTPKPSQKRRYCLKSIVNLCPGYTTGESCTNSTVEPLSGEKSFNNYNCTLCNDSCFPPSSSFVCRFTPSERFLLKLEYGKYNRKFSVQSTSCSSKGMMFDHKLQECVQDIPTPSGNEGKIRVLVWFAPFKDSEFSENDFQTVMKQYFGIKHTQIHNVSIDTVSKKFLFQDSTILFHLVSSTFLLTPEQIFNIVFKADSKSSPLNLRSFIHFKKPFNVTFNNITYAIIKTTFRPFSCNTRLNTCSQAEFVLGVIDIVPRYVNEKMKFVYDKNVSGNIKMCKEYDRRLCKTLPNSLMKTDFVINANLSIYHKEKGMLYKFTQYVVTGDSISLCNLKQFKESTCSSDKSCKGRCSNQTQWRTEVNMRCSCDPDCYEVFNDCCSDYVKYCGAQKPTETLTKKYKYTCVEFGVRQNSTASDTLWMVTKCRSRWAYDTTRTKCEETANKFNMSDPYVNHPVISHDNVTFRNLYCAICNHVKNYDPWPFDSNNSFSFPETYNFTQKMRFFSSHKGQFLEESQILGPGANQARRYCSNEIIINHCPSYADQFGFCANGDVAPIRIGQRYYKNTHCAACYGMPSEVFSCFSGESFSDCSNCTVELPVFARSRPVILPVIEPVINPVIVPLVRPVVNIKSSKLILIRFPEPIKILQQSHVVYVWLEPPRNLQNTSFTPPAFQESLKKYLNISRSQLFDISIVTVLRSETTASFFYLVSSTIILQFTEQQRLELLDANRSDKLSTKAKLLNYIYFSEPFILKIKGFSYTVVKTTHRPLACVEKTTYSPEEYILRGKEKVIIRSTNKTYEKLQYYKQNSEKLDGKPGNITVCEKYIPTKCNGSTVLYTINEYIMTVNLSIFVKETSSLYDYGEYEILSNKSVTACQFFKLHKITEIHQIILYDEVLGYITLLSFLLSIISLIFLLVTYIIFPQLRTLPGKNLMNFAASLVLFQIFWLPLKEIRSKRLLCKIMAIVEHYFLMTTFVSMSVIAFHTCKVFARRLPAQKMSESHKQKLFSVYLTLVWLLPALFVGSCVVLDHQDVVKIGYGELEICWLTEDNAYTYFVIIPIAVFLSFNVIAFVTAALFLRKHGQNKAARQASGNRRSKFLIYVKLSTLMGFAWLFGLLALVVKPKIVFWYLFVIFTSFQGVFVAMAFVLNAKTFVLYKQWYRSGSRAPIAQWSRRNAPRNV